ncbi:MAG: hypothetical protein AAGJ12_11935, partial [Bacteroidota bacterium]
YADGADYLEPHKGAIALNRLQNIIGREKYNRVILDFIQKKPEEQKVFLDLYQKLLDAVPLAEKEKVADLFERVNIL